jgi:hypothetical protein
MRIPFVVMWTRIPFRLTLERVCESCLVPSLPSRRHENTLCCDEDAHSLIKEMERVCERCLVPSLPSSRNTL